MPGKMPLEENQHQFTGGNGRVRVNWRRTSVVTPLFVLATLLSLLAAASISEYPGYFTDFYRFQKPPIDAQEILSKCQALKTVPGPSPAFVGRDVSDRFELGTNATLIRNCTIFTGEKNGTIIVHGGILLDKGIVKGLGKVSQRVIDNTPNLTTIEAHGAWVTPGLVDLHSHLGLLSAPMLSGSFDVNSPNGPVAPWLRSIDGFNTHDDAFQLAISGGVTSAQILPGSGNAIGGQAFMVKLRRTKERSPSSMVIEPPHSFTGNEHEPYMAFRWRHMKQACGENLKRYGTRMDSMWSFRSAYNEARNIKNLQDAYCAKVEAGLWDSVDGSFPESFKWEMLVDVLRGKVKIANHCYEAVDLDGIVRLTNEFEFPVASFHHASEAYLVPEVLKRTWGGTPAIAIFATNHRYKRESFRGSEFAGRILIDEGIPVVMKTDHPVINSRYLIHEAQQAHYFSLPPHFALASVTSAPAKAAGLSHRIGVLSVGSDADVVMWDSHPLQLGATPIKVWIDGIRQIPIQLKKDKGPVIVGKGKDGEEWRQPPDVPNWDKERNETLKWDGLPPLQGKKTHGRVAFTNVKAVWSKKLSGEIEDLSSASNEGGRTVVVESGKIICAGPPDSCAGFVSNLDSVDLHGGSISPGLMSYGSPLGIEEIAGEPSTGDGRMYDALRANVPKIMDDVGGVVRAMDGLMFGTRNALTAYRSGVTLATTSLARPRSLFKSDAHLVSGLSTTFHTGSAHAMERAALIQDVTALHITIGRPHPLDPYSVPSVSTQVAVLRRLLYGWESTDKETGAWFKKAAEGVLPLVVDVDSSDIMATLLILKAEIENNIGSRMRMVFSGATEAHILAREISDANVGVILTSRPYPSVWDERKILPGPPLTNDTALLTLLEKGVVVGIGVREAWQARNTRFDLKWAVLESNGRINERQVYAMATTDLERLLGVRDIDGDDADLVAFDGGNIFDLSSKVVAIISARREVVDFFG